jgi:hypothetical protein
MGSKPSCRLSSARSLVNIMNELFSVALLAALGLVLGNTFRGLGPDQRMEVRFAALQQAEGLHNIRCNCFIFAIAGAIRGDWPVAAGATTAFAASFVLQRRATAVQGGTCQTELGFYLAFSFVLPVRLAALSLSAGSNASVWAIVGLLGLVGINLLPSEENEVVKKMQKVSAPGHNLLCVCVLVVCGPVVGAVDFNVAHLAAGIAMVSLALARGLNCDVARAQLAFFLHWPLPLLGGRLPVALLILAGELTPKAATIMAAAGCVWLWALHVHRPRLARRVRQLEG